MAQQLVGHQGRGVFLANHDHGGGRVWLALPVMQGLRLIPGMWERLVGVRPFSDRQRGLSDVSQNFLSAPLHELEPDGL